MFLRTSLLLVLLAVSLIWGGPAAAQTTDAAPGVPTDKEVHLFRGHYGASPIRSITFARELDPEEAVREEIYINRVLAARYSADPESEEDIKLQADVDFYQTQWLLDYWLGRRVTVESPTAEEIRAAYEANLERFAAPDMVTFDHVFVMIKSDATNEEIAAAEERAQRAHALLKRGVAFDRVAAEYSDDPGARENKGRVGPIALSRLMDELANVLVEMEPGQVSDPIATPFGYEIIRLEELVDGGIRPLEQVAAALEGEILAERAGPLHEAALARAAEEFPATVHEDLLVPGEPVDMDAILVEMNDKSYSVRDVYWAVWATHQFNTIEDDAERLLEGLPRFVTTRHVLADCRARGYFEHEDVQTMYRLVRERLLAERVHRTWMTEREPSEEVLRALYEERPEAFRSFPKVKGTMYLWRAEGWREMSPTMVQYHREGFRRKVVEAMRGHLVDGMPRESVWESATDNAELDWVEPGPLGMQADEAVFATQPGAFSMLFDVGGGIGIVWVEDRREGEVPAFEEVRERAGNLWRSRESRAERDRAVQDILARYASIR